jgi:hypothetical protein
MEARLASADGHAVLSQARDQDRVLVPCDHDFVQLLFGSADKQPSVILVREAGALAATRWPTCCWPPCPANSRSCCWQVRSRR